MITDSNDPWAMIRELADRVRKLENANPLEHASISRGTLRVLNNGVPVATIGHEDGKSGVLLPAPGGGRVTVQEHVTASHEYPTRRIKANEDWRNETGPKIALTEGKVSTLEGKVSVTEGKVSVTEGKVSTLEGKASTASSKISTLEGKASTAESKLSALESKVSVIEGKLGVSG